MSLLLSHTLEGLGVGLLVQEPATIGVTLDPTLIVGVICLRAVTYRADPLVVAFRGISCHLVFSFIVQSA